MDFLKIIFIVGPTAVGKSEVANIVAQKVRGEIISCDSMQVYREISIANNKPDRAALEAIPHHLVNIRSISEEWDVAHFNRLALDAIQDVHARNNVPVVVGGSGLYMQILLDGIFEGGKQNESLRTELKELARQYGNEFLYDKLKEADPVAAARIHPNDMRRVIRALEVCITEQIPVSEKQKDREGLWGRARIELYALDRERSELYQRINQRVEDMFRQGLVEEIQALEGMAWSKTALKIIGVQEVQKLVRGEWDLNAAQAAIQMNTRRLAKRQLTWFRKDKRLQWLKVHNTDSAPDVAEQILDLWHAWEKAEI